MTPIYLFHFAFEIIRIQLQVDSMVKNSEKSKKEKLMQMFYI